MSINTNEAVKDLDILLRRLCYGEVLGGDGSHLCHLLRLISPLMPLVIKTSGTERYQGKRELAVDSRMLPMKSSLFTKQSIVCGRTAFLTT